MIRSLILSALVALMATPALGQSVEPGYSAYDLQLGGARYRSFANTGGDEIYVGVPDLGRGAARAQRNIRWAAVNTVGFAVDPQADVLEAWVVNENGVYTLAYDDWFARRAALDGGDVPGLNVLHISMAGRDAGSTVAFEEVTINGMELGDFEPVDGWNDWMVEGVDLVDGFVIEGVLVLDGPFSNSQERSRLEIKAGWRAPPACMPIVQAVAPNDRRLPGIDAACCVIDGAYTEGNRLDYLRCVIREAVARRITWRTRPRLFDLLRAALRAVR